MPGDLGGPDTRTWRWEQALNIFSDGYGHPTVAQRETVIGTTWLKWSTHQVRRGPNNHLPTSLVYAESLTWYQSTYAVADATPEVEEALKNFAKNSGSILDSLLADTNTVAKRATFTPASDGLQGVSELLTKTVVPKLEEWRNKTGHHGDAYQGQGADGFWQVLDGLVYKCRNLAEQLSPGRPTWEVLRETQEYLRQAAVLLEQQGRQKWLSSASTSYDTGLSFRVEAPAAELAWPAGVVRAIWTSPKLKADIAKSRVNRDREHLDHGDAMPKSDILGGKLNEAGPWQRLEEAAKKVWAEHLATTLDSAAASAVGLLTASHQMAHPYFRPITTPVEFNRTGADPGPGTGPGGGAGGGGPNSGGGSGTGGGDGSTGGSGSNNPGGGPPPPPPLPPPPGGNKGPSVVNGGGSGSGSGGGQNPLLNGGDRSLKVPSGSYVGPTGAIIGPNGKPVLDRNGKPVIVPRGSRVDSNGNVVGPRGDAQLDEKDRLRKPYDVDPSVVSGGNGSSELQRYLDSLRRAPAPPSPVRSPELPPLTMSKYDPIVHNGPGSFGSGLVGASGIPAPNTMSQDWKPSPPSGTPESSSSPKGTTGIGAGPGTGPGAGGTGGTGGVPFYPPTAGGMGGAGVGGQDQKGERDRTTWLAEDEETWGTDPAVAPGVLGRRKRRQQARSSTVHVRGGDVERDHAFGSGSGTAGQGAGTTI
ncbi:hypothetical protein [Lentzea jiangxiensis]|uniref:Uncharacterized protein n=1 Tax=Lentzea jiangxiensis TaxID=641025 RepID=A0A1H0X3G2_9PSEU|nr:hypothetical protein [Lentzea jiangxiensis]SDP97452.1 hypothetical protein SAMN05421507_13119 [Lentzea jiangxiensis]